jgi:hypothetical protein
VASSIATSKILESWDAKAVTPAQAALPIASSTGSGGGNSVDLQLAIGFKEQNFVDRIGVS